MSRELRKVLELDQSEDESEGELGRPSAPFPTPSTITRVSERGEGKEGLDQQSSPRLRPSAARGNRAPSTQQPQPAVQSKPQPVGQSTLQPAVQSTLQPAVQSKPQPVRQSTQQPAVQSKPQPVRQSTLQPVVQSKTPQPVTQSTTHSVGQSTPQTVVQPAGAGGGVPTVDIAGSTVAVITVPKGPEEQR